ncbi:metallophosphoesterase [Psychroserpens sp. XS_ASV72]|uniref:metallophosphoesterase n=1 Tax=Psychroserpens sp. XS_ASV72 TaxID=3241293 RepID=UPI003518E3C9
MSRWAIRLIILSIIILVAEIYAFQALKTITRSRWVKIVWLLVSFLVYANLLYVIFSTPRSIGQTIQFQYAVGFMLTILIPKAILIFSMFAEDLWRLSFKLFSWVSPGETAPLPGRREFISKIALGLAAIPFASFLYGIIQGRYNYKVLQYQLTFPDLPEAFDGIKITQISDIHSGSFTNPDKIQYGIDLIKEQQSDLILFTGDIVNNVADEMDDWIDMFKTLHAPLGKFSVLGNHDYGDYVNWDTEEQKIANFRKIQELHPKIGFDLLMNENRFIEKDGQKLAIIGVENWGKGFNQSGDLKKASAGVKDDDFKILLSHDPSHWEYEVKKDDFHYHLTLSGHTHGLQMGIEIPGFIKWSPSKYVYKQWAGLYNEFGRFINVNRGFGYHAFPGRVGIWPEVTVITLKKGEIDT